VLFPHLAGGGAGIIPLTMFLIAKRLEAAGAGGGCGDA